MARQKQAERFLLPLVDLFLRVGKGRHRRVVACGGCATAGVAEIEDRRLTELRVLLVFLTGGLCLGEHRQHAAAGGTGRVERAAFDQRFDRFFVHRAVIDTATEVPDRAERSALFARADDRVDRLRPDVLDGVESETDLSRPVVPGLVDDAEVVARLVDVGGQNLDAHLVALGDEERHLVLGLHHRRDQRRHVLGRVVGLEPRCPVRDQRVAGGVRAVEGVVGRSLVGRPQLLDHALVGARLACALDEAVLELRHLVAQLLADRLAQIVGLGAREAGDLLGDLHRLLLVEDHAVGRLGDRAQALVEVLDRLGVAFVARVGVDVPHRARAVERHEGDEVVELGGAHLAQRFAHPFRLELEDADRVAAREHLVGLAIVERQLRHVRPLAGGLLDDVERRLDDVEVAQPEEVHLQKADLLQRLHRVLRHDAVPALAAARVLGELERDDLGERTVGDHHRGGVDRVVAHDPLEAARGVDDAAGVGLGVVHAAQIGLLGQVLVETLGAPHHRLGDQLRQAVTGGVVVTEHARRVARGGARQHAAEGDDLGDAVAPVLLRDVLDHALPPFHREVDVDIGHRHPLGVEEALEQKVVGERIDVGDLEAVRDDRAGRGPAPGTDRDAVLFGEADEVPDDQEVGAEAHALDHVELVLEALASLGGRRVTVALAQPGCS